MRHIQTSEHFSNIDSFFGDVFDRLGNELNAEFKRKGWLLDLGMKFCEKEQYVHITKVYKSKYYRHLFQKIWHKKSNYFTKEEATFSYEVTNEHVA